jgi:hypothetical protein
MLAQEAGIAYTCCMQYTLRGVPKVVDDAVRERAKAEGRSLNEVAVAALAQGLGIDDEGVVKRDLSDVVGSWKKDAAAEGALAAQDRVDGGLWR